MSLTADGFVRCTLDEAGAEGAAGCLTCGWIYTPQGDDAFWRTPPEAHGGPYLCDRCGNEDLYGLIGLMFQGLVEWTV